MTMMFCGAVTLIAEEPVAVKESENVTVSTPVTLRPPDKLNAVPEANVSDWPARLPESVTTIVLTFAVANVEPAPVNVEPLSVTFDPLLLIVTASLVAV